MQIEKTDGRGLITSAYRDTNRPMNRDIWLHEAFPEWGTFLNREIENCEVPKGQVRLWYCGGPSWVLKTDEGAIFLIDQYAGGSSYTSYEYCGVCKQAGASDINWLRLNPQVIDPFSFSHIDGVISTHAHGDHCDIYTVKGTLESTNAKYYGPAVAAQKFKEFGVPEDRIVETHVGDVIKIPGGEIEILMNFDNTAIRTGFGTEVQEYDKACHSFMFKTSAGNILFMGDTWYHDGYFMLGRKYDIDVAIFDMGMCPPGAMDKMNPYDCARLGRALQAKVLIPDHWDNWANSMFDPDLLINQFERIVHEITPETKTVIMRCGGSFDYPRDKDIKRYRYPDQSEKYTPEKSEYANLK